MYGGNEIESSEKFYFAKDSCREKNLNRDQHTRSGTVALASVVDGIAEC